MAGTAAGGPRWLAPLPVRELRAEQAGLREDLQRLVEALVAREEAK